MKEKLVKSKERVQKHGEVFTPAWLVKDMLDLLPKEEIWDNIEATILDPACGNGNFLDGILRRKLSALSAGKGLIEFNYNMLICLSSVYGVDIQLDNVKECRERLFNQIRMFVYLDMQRFNSYHSSILDIAEKIVERNIICGNFLTGKEADANARDTENDFHFTFYTFPPMDKLTCFKDIKQKRYTLLNLCPDSYKLTK